MKKIFALAALSVGSVAMADWGSATGDGGYPHVCVQNRAGYGIQVFLNQQAQYVAPYQIVRFTSYQPHVLFAMNTRQLDAYRRPAWVQQYVPTSTFGCNAQNTVAVLQYGNVLVIR